ncbi:uncharacterized protein K460DRAFT_355822 [Cucurbitaria berberidis CBS 394.84]|uniref:Uncharacterized protein n=1 Tax=Cucurbitaria berberidis CBS 394.84 TaxID=1168544 RepID=A0A9P4GJ40_9PLEO|nr:uncharacterized protein K460DRAFT_355822 [Cucurbitaria berberidis CBS 394.84]KAF1846101.1 hypothetical protein K460DRAFT_355822 [Cucurbitaria berberidis CBS 394.84]
MGPSRSTYYLEKIMPNARNATQSLDFEALERRQSISGTPTRHIPATPASCDLPDLIDQRTCLTDALNAEDPCRGKDPIYQNKRTIREALADTLPRLYHSMRKALGFIWNLVKFQVQCSLLVTAFNLAAAFHRGDVMDLQWVPHFPTSLESLKELTINWETPANGYLLHIYSFWWGWIHGLGRLVLWKLPKALGRVLCNVAVKGVMISGEYVGRSGPGKDITDAWGHGLHPVMRERMGGKGI